MAELIFGWFMDRTTTNKWISNPRLFGTSNSKEQVNEKRKSLRERQKRYRERHANTENGSIDDGWDNALITEPEYRIQNTEYIKQNTENKELLPTKS
jgi:hypothetical protein